MTNGQTRSPEGGRGFSFAVPSQGTRIPTLALPRLDMRSTTCSWHGWHLPLPRERRFGGFVDETAQMLGRGRPASAGRPSWPHRHQLVASDPRPCAPTPLPSAGFVAGSGAGGAVVAPGFFMAWPLCRRHVRVPPSILAALRLCAAVARDAFGCLQGAIAGQHLIAGAAGRARLRTGK